MTPGQPLLDRLRLLANEMRCSEQMRTVHHPVPQKGRPLRANRVDLQPPGSVALVNSNGRMTLSPFRTGIFRIYIQNRRERQAWARDNSWTVNLSSADRRGWTYSDAGQTLHFTCVLRDGSQASVDAQPGEGLVSCRVRPDFAVADATAPQVTRDWILIRKRLDTAGQVRVFGFGENALPMDKAGSKVIMWNTAPFVHRTGGGGLYQSWPVAIFLRQDGLATGLVFDSPSYSVFDFSPDGKEMDYAVKDTELNYFVLLGPELPDVVRQLALLTGTLSPIPKWALGYHQSRWSYAPSSRVREVAAEFRKRDIPCDALYLDIDHMDRFKCFTWGPGFDDHERLIGDLHAQGFKVVTILNPGLKVDPGYRPYESGLRWKAFVTGRGGRPASGKVWAGKSYFPDFTSAPVRQWWGTLVSEFVASGVDGIWCDMNEPTTFDSPFSLPPRAVHRPSSATAVSHERVHNVYGYLMSRATYEGLSKTQRLPFVMTRSTYLGGQKYATTWTGDNQSDWDNLRAGIPMILSLGLSGQPISGPDIGGYAGTPTPELYERWILQGALYPYSRTHSRKGTGDQEPWSFGPKVETSARKAIKLRYRLIPYLYSLTFESTLTGEPLARPIFYYGTALGALDPEFYETEFLLGPHLLVAPLMDQSPTRMCYLPPGKWHSWWSLREVEGGRVYETVAERDTDLPLFIAENAVVPLYAENESMSSVPDRSLQSLELVVTLGTRAEGRVVEYFDGESLLAYDVRFTAEEGAVRGEVGLVRNGSSPTRYRPPQILQIRLNRRVSAVDVTSGCSTRSLEPVGESWTRVTIKDPAFPVKCVFR